MSNELPDILSLWRKNGYLPPEGTPVTPTPEFDVKAYVVAQRMARFKEFCPVEFQKKIIPKLIESPAAWALADAWEGTHKGVWLWSHGTGMAKSRMLWRKYGQLHVRKGKSVLRITGFNLAEAYHDSLIIGKTSSFYGRIMGCDVVMLDDLDKMKLPDDADGFKEKEEGARNARMLRELFDRFYERHAPVLVTANEPIAWFTERIGPSGGRRMAEVCDEICFDAQELGAKY